MATTVFKAETYELQDGSEVEVKPLTINRLRRFMTIIGELNKLGSEESKYKDDEFAMMNILFEAGEIAIERSRPELAPAEGDNASQKRAKRAKLEDVLDLPTLNKILEVAGGIKLDNPNQTAVASDGTI